MQLKSIQNDLQVLDLRTELKFADRPNLDLPEADGAPTTRRGLLETQRDFT